MPIFQYEAATLHFVARSGTTYLGEAGRRIAECCKAGELEASDIDEELFAKHLYLPECPEPDLLIRTSGESRLSNFMLWQLSYSEILFTQTLWPDFTKEEFCRAIIDYQARDRRFGGIST